MRSGNFQAHGNIRAVRRWSLEHMCLRCLLQSPTDVSETFSGHYTLRFLSLSAGKTNMRPMVPFRSHSDWNKGGNSRGGNMYKSWLICPLKYGCTKTHSGNVDGVFWVIFSSMFGEVCVHGDILVGLKLISVVSPIVARTQFRRLFLGGSAR